MGKQYQRRESYRCSSTLTTTIPAFSLKQVLRKGDTWMLPTPASLGNRRAFGRFVSPRKRLRDTLLTRSRATNLAVALLAAVCALSLLSNLYFYSTVSWSGTPHPGFASAVLSTINRHGKLSKLDHLIVVPCHAIWKGVDATSRLDEDSWMLEPYQKGTKRIGAFFDHIAQG